jgi:drug/metabolite transporter (DMT)-like permease
MSVLRRQESVAAIALLSVTASWGASFVLMKDAIERQPIPDFLFTRFTVAALVMIAARPRVLRDISRRVLWTGSIVGLILGAGYITQTIGLEMSTAAITGFLTGLYVILTPLIGWLFLKQKLNTRVIIGALLSLSALAILSITDVGLSDGTIWVVICAILFAMHIVTLGVWSPGADAYALTLVQILVVAVMTGLWTFGDGDGFVMPPDAGVWNAILITAVFATALGFFLQTWAQGHMDPGRVAILLTTEVLWSGIIAVGVGQEPLTSRLLMGGAIMFTAMLVIEWPGKKRAEHELVHLE